MEIKIKLPNPYSMDTDEWFEQMELSLYHAKKAYEKILENRPEQKDDISLYFTLSELQPYIDGIDDDNSPCKIEDLNSEDYFDKYQEIEIIISH